MLNKFKSVFFIFVLGVSFFLGTSLTSYFLDLKQETKRLHAELINQKEEYKQINEYVAQLESDYIEQLQISKEAEKRFKEVIKSKDERIKLLSDATYLIGRHVTKQHGPDYYFETPKRTKNYVLNELKIEGQDSPSIGYILIKNDGRTYKRNYKFEILVETLQTVDEDSGRIKVYSKAFLVKKEKSPLDKRVQNYKSWKNKRYPLKITGGTALIDPTVRNQLTPKFHWWAPSLNANIDFLGSDPSPGLGISLMGYGITKNDLDFKFLQFGVHYNESNYQSTLVPAMWRPFSSIVSNTYIGPGIVYDKGQISYFLGIQVGL